MVELIDVEDVIRTCGEHRKRYAADKEKPGLTGVIARCALASDEPLSIWRAKEANAGTDPNHIIAAIVAAFTATLLGEICQYLDDPEAQILGVERIVAEMQLRLTNAIKAVNAGVIEVSVCEVKQAGRA